MHATRCASHSSLDNVSPGGLVFRRDMFLNIPLIADIIALQEARQQGIDRRLMKANRNRIPHEFTVGELVKKRLKVGPKDKLRRAYEGPFRIEQVHTNGNVTIRLNGPVRERINIRRIEPWRL